MEIISGQMDELLKRLTRYWYERADAAIADHGAFFVALSGGRTPEYYHPALVGMDFPFWPQTHVFLVDERCVPSNHPDNNFAMIQRTFLDHVAIPKQQIHPILISDEGVKQTAENYELHLKEAFNGADYPAFDLVMLGLGTDGHTASLFEQEDLQAPGWVTDTSSERHAHKRISLTLPVLNHAAHCAFFVLGADKQKVFERVCERDQSLVASHLNPASGLTAFVDFC